MAACLGASLLPPRHFEAAPAAGRRVRAMSLSTASPPAPASNSAFDIKSVLRPHLLELGAYTPIEPFEVRLSSATYLLVLLGSCIVWPGAASL